MRVLIAPDCFGDSLTAVEAAQAIAAGWRAARPADVLILAPQSDGGPGFLEVLAACDSGLRRHHLRVSGPLSAPVEAGWLFEPATATAYLECAQACGLSLLGGPPTPQTALAANSGGGSANWSAQLWTRAPAPWWWVWAAAVAPTAAAACSRRSVGRAGPPTGWPAYG